MKNTAVVSVQPSDLLELVFSNRNRVYGAYLLRRNYPNYLARALGIGFLAILTFFGIVQLLTASNNAARRADESGIILCGIDLPISTAEKTPPPVLPQPATPPAARSTMKFVPPVVQPDHTVPENFDAPTLEAIVNAGIDIGASNHTNAQELPPSLSNAIFSNNTAGSGILEHPAEEVYEGGDVQKMPSFPGGEGELRQYLARNVMYPPRAREMGIEGQVVVSFVVDTNGKAADITIIKDPGAGCGQEVVRVVASMPHWIPGEAGGLRVKVRFYLPVGFELR